jgi:hypothetical protein
VNSIVAQAPQGAPLLTADQLSVPAAETNSFFYMAPKLPVRAGLVLDTLCHCQFCGDALGAAEGDGATLSDTFEGRSVAAGETLAVGLVDAFGAVVVAGEPVAGTGEAVIATAGVGIPINSLCNALSLELR